MSTSQKFPSLWTNQTPLASLTTPGWQPAQAGWDHLCHMGWATRRPELPHGAPGKACAGIGLVSGRCVHAGELRQARLSMSQSQSVRASEWDTEELGIMLRAVETSPWAHQTLFVDPRRDSPPGTLGWRGVQTDIPSWGPQGQLLGPEPIKSTPGDRRGTFSRLVSVFFLGGGCNLISEGEVWSGVVFYSELRKSYFLKSMVVNHFSSVTGSPSVDLNSHPKN